ncbi:unnamed protein product, partial [Brassica oleracea]
MIFLIHPLYIINQDFVWKLPKERKAQCSVSSSSQ